MQIKSVFQARNQRNLRDEPQIKIQSMNPDWEEGSCSQGICGLEAACIDLGKGSHICVCPHDESSPTKDLRCPRKAVPVHELPPEPIHNIIPPVATNLTSSNLTTPSNASDFTRSSTRTVFNGTHARAAESTQFMGLTVSEMGILMSLGLLSGIVGLFLMFCWQRRNSNSCYSKPNKKDGAPVSLRKSLLEQERYITNPQYTPCTLPSVPLLPRESLTLLEDIGEGCFGKVFKGEMRGEEIGLRIVAIKVLKEAATKEAEEEFMREVEIMSTFRHENILSLIGVVPRESSKSPWMVFEFMPHGDLLNVLRSNIQLLRKNDQKNLPSLTKENQISIAVQIASGMCYLAAQRFVHRDLACRNCLVGDELVVKIADFGMSRDVYTSDYYKMGGSRLLPVRWMSPESVMYGLFTLESDVWSFGVVLWEIFSLGKQPYYGHSNEKVVELVKQGSKLVPPEDCPVHVTNLMRACWRTDPKQRPQFPELLDQLTKVQVHPVSQENLPRPPAFPVGLGATLPQTSDTTLDSENYLKPQQVVPREYLLPLPD
ncbi:hypothetical protein LSTR_LSTR002683 [Laodelphax striatellus]|uniref:Protein kinase domain-containing protein n=1 Tax=Laodelphax striatellus TaxID=195883 RepID=A0A482X6Z4_LAOST|nr:hypothetical protein LSTR_LSTR002683 [Laodelphax striatellus]